MIQLYRVILPVSDIERAAQFYGALLDANGSRVSPGRHYFGCGGATTSSILNVVGCASPYGPPAATDAVAYPTQTQLAAARLGAVRRDDVHEARQQAADEMTEEAGQRHGLLPQTIDAGAPKYIQ